MNVAEAVEWVCVCTQCWRKMYDVEVCVVAPSLRVSSSHRGVGVFDHVPK